MLFEFPSTCRTNPEAPMQSSLAELDFQHSIKQQSLTSQERHSGLWNSIAGTLNVHPVTLLAFSYLLADKALLPHELLASIADELEELYGAKIPTGDK